METTNIEIAYYRYTLQVTDAGESYTTKFSLDKNVKRVLGIQLTSDRLDLLFARGSQRIEVNGDEIFPEDWESRTLISGTGVPPNDRYFRFGNGVLTGNGELKVLYKDKNLPSEFAAYEVAFLLICQK
jgi:hypothetical protein